MAEKRRKGLRFVAEKVSTLNLYGFIKQIMSDLQDVAHASMNRTVSPEVTKYQSRSRSVIKTAGTCTEGM